ncbi:MAG: cation:proton antiporter [Candidatus Micrarchaeota archaeon]|nr:cation:proton antiporter [Candidatus Micrarchaeota archaeon]
MELQVATIGALGILVLAGVASHIFLRKTGFSDVLLLMLFGVAAGYFLPESSVAGLSGIALPFAAITLLMIILDEGLNLSFEHLRRSAHKAIAFGIVSFSLALIAGFTLSYFIMNYSFTFSLLIGALFGSVAPELLSGFLASLGASKEARTLGEIESVLSDALSVILSLILVAAVISGENSFNPLPIEIAYIVLGSIALGAVCAVLWRALLSKSEHENQHLLVIGLAAVLYAIAGALGADSVISVFTFAFFLGNISHPSIEEMRRFQSEISFFLRTFFFVYLGMLLFHSPKNVDVGLFALALSLLLAVARALAGKIAGHLEPSARANRLLESVSARGLTVAALSIVAYDGLTAAGATPPVDLPLLALFVIFFTNVLSAWLVLKKGGKRKVQEFGGGKADISVLARGGMDSL